MVGMYLEEFARSTTIAQSLAETQPEYADKCS
jgi:hypothetical protein